MAVTFIDLGNYGQMGNQLFEAAAVISLALNYNDDYILPNCSLKGTTNIPIEKFTDRNNIKFSSHYEEPHFHYAQIPYKPNLNIKGYFQSWLYHQPFIDEIREILYPKCNIKTADVSELCSIHVRRTDYLIHHGCYHILTRQNYYDKAMEIINTKKYLIFSDDIKWCKENFKGNEFEFSENTVPHVDLYLMANCAQNIIANSSFSWWGAYLNGWDNNKVIAPATWFGPKLAPTHNTQDLYVPGWIKI